MKITKASDEAKKKAEARLKKLRKQIDDADRNFLKSLANRFKVVAEIGRLKVKNGYPIHQQSRMLEMLNGRKKDAEKLKLDGKLVYNIFDLIHSASITCQEDVAKEEQQKKKAKKK